MTSLQAERSGAFAGAEELFFDINAKLEEQKKDNNQVTLGFSIAISTKPNVVKYNTTGLVTLTGKGDDIKKKLEVNPKTKIPQILFTIYQHVFNSIYMLSSNLNTPYPPPDLLHPMAEKIQIISSTPAEKPAETPPVAASPNPAGPGATSAPTATPTPAATPPPAPAQPAPTAPPTEPAQPAPSQPAPSTEPTASPTAQPAQAATPTQPTEQKPPQ